MSTNLEVAETILAQLGGTGRLSIMIGAKDFLGDERAVQFRHMKAKRGINRIRIELEPSDTYKVRFFAGAGLNIREVEAVEDVYVESLRRTIEATTGLYLSL